MKRLDRKYWSLQKEKKHIAWHVIFLSPRNLYHLSITWKGFVEMYSSSNTCLRMNVCCTNKTRMKKTWSASIINHIVLHHCVNWIYAWLLSGRRGGERGEELFRIVENVLWDVLLTLDNLKKFAEGILSFKVKGQPIEILFWTRIANMK